MQPCSAYPLVLAIFVCGNDPFSLVAFLLVIWRCRLCRCGPERAGLGRRDAHIFQPNHLSIIHND